MVAALAPMAGKALASAARALFSNPAARQAVLKNKDAILSHAGKLQSSIDKLGGAGGGMMSMVAFPYGAMLSGLAGKNQITNAAGIFTKVAGRMDG